MTDTGRPRRKRRVAECRAITVEPGARLGSAIPLLDAVALIVVSRGDVPLEPIWVRHAGDGIRRSTMNARN